MPSAIAKLRVGLRLLRRVLADQQAGAAEDRKTRRHIEDRGAVAHADIEHMLEPTEAIDDDHVGALGAHGVDNKVERLLDAFVADLAGDVVELELIADHALAIECEAFDMRDQLGVRLGHIGEVDHAQAAACGGERDLLRQDGLASPRRACHDIE